MVKILLAMQETQVQSQGWEDVLEKGMTTSFSTLAWKNSMDRGVWQATVHGVAESDTAERLTLLLFSLHGSSSVRFLRKLHTVFRNGSLIYLPSN